MASLLNDRAPFIYGMLTTAVGECVEFAVTREGLCICMHCFVPAPTP